MKMLDVKIGLEKLRKDRERWGQGHAEFRSGYNWVLTRLVHEAAINYMGAEQIAQALGVSGAHVRKKMRDIGLDPRGGKRALNSKASQVLLDNAELMGIEPHEVDLTSPLAYLPMGEELRKQYQDRTLARVTELEDEPEVSGNLAALVDALALADCHCWESDGTHTGPLIGCPLHGKHPSVTTEMDVDCTHCGQTSTVTL